MVSERWKMDSATRDILYMREYVEEKEGCPSYRYRHTLETQRKKKRKQKRQK